MLTNQGSILTAHNVNDVEYFECFQMEPSANGKKKVIRMAKYDTAILNAATSKSTPEG